MALLKPKAKNMSHRIDADGSTSTPDNSEPYESKLLATISVKVGEGPAKLYRRIARDSGMFESQVYRMILERAATLCRRWDTRTNFKTFVQEIDLHGEQLSLFSSSEDGNQRNRRNS